MENAGLPAEDDTDGTEELVTGVCDTIGLKLDPIEIFETSVDSPATEGR